MPNIIPENESTNVAGLDEILKRRDALDISRLASDLEYSKAVTKEINTSIAIKKVAVYFGICVVLIFFAVLAFAICNVIWMPPELRVDEVAIVIALIVAPFTSITAIVIAFFIGAFRKFNDRDIQTMGNGVSNLAMKVSGGG